jgi:hypothetical protein
MRKQLAVWVFLASLIGMIITTIQNYVLSNGMEVMGDPFTLGFTATIFLFALGFFVYSMKMRKRDLLV